MIVLDWRHPSLACPSLGNICGMALATEYIYSVLKKDIGIIVPEWYSDIWPLFINQDKIFFKEPEGHEIRICDANLLDKNKLYKWVEIPLIAAGYNLQHEKIKTRICWLNDDNSNKILIYPREHHNGNRTYSSEYWIELIKLLNKKGFKVISLLHVEKSDRDGFNSKKWCDEVRQRSMIHMVLPPTICNIQAACSMCKYSIGSFTGPSFMLLKSDIKQIVLQSETDDSNKTALASHNLPMFDKPIKLIVGTSLDWIKLL